MARGNDPGKDFDDQYRRSKFRGDENARLGRGAWADDKKIRDGGELRQPPASNDGCADKAAVLLTLLGGLAWGASETVQRFL